jgi:hypothetical protein
MLSNKRIALPRGPGLNTTLYSALRRKKRNIDWLSVRKAWKAANPRIKLQPLWAHLICKVRLMDGRPPIVGLVSR